MDKKLNLSILLSLIGTLSFGQGSFDPAAGQAGSQAIHKDSSIIVAWADFCTIDRGYMDIANPGNGLATHGTDNDALGYADNIVVSLGDSGVATYILGVGALNDGPGYDFAIFENSFSDDYLELAHVEVSSDGSNYFRFPSVSEVQTDSQVGAFDFTDPTEVYNLAGKYRGGYGVPFDLAELPNDTLLNKSNVRFVRIVDVVGSINPVHGTVDSLGNIINDPYPTNFDSSGFDLDALGLLNLVQSLEENELELSVYPNPTTDFIYIKSKEQQLSWELYDLNGKLLVTGLSKQISMENLPKGIYALKITSNNGIRNLKVCKR